MATLICHQQNSTTPTTPSSTSEAPQQQNPIQYVIFRDRIELVQALNQSLGGLKNLHLIQICFDDSLVWLLIESNPERIILQNCSHDVINGSSSFGHLIDLLVGSNSSKTCFKFATQFKDCTTQWTLCNKFPSPGFNELEPITSLLFILPGSVPLQSVMNDISSLFFLPSKPDVSKPLSLEFKETIKSVLDQSFPRLKRLLLKDIRLGDDIENFLFISQLKLDLIYLWYCVIDTANIFWSTLCESLHLVESMYEGNSQPFQFAIPISGHTTQIVDNPALSFSIPGSSNLGRGLIFSLEQDLPNDLSWDNLSLLALVPSEVERFSRQLSS